MEAFVISVTATIIGVISAFAIQKAHAFFNKKQIRKNELRELLQEYYKGIERPIWNVLQTIVNVTEEHTMILNKARLELRPFLYKTSTVINNFGETYITRVDELIKKATDDPTRKNYSISKIKTDYDNITSDLIRKIKDTINKL